MAMKGRNTWVMTVGCAVVCFLSAGSVHSELTFTNNLLAWYKADIGMYTTPIGATPSGHGDPVGRWEDQSGNDYHLTRITESERPLVDTGAGPLSSSALHFNGNDYLLMCTEGTEASTLYFPSGTELGTVFMVFRPHSEITSLSVAQMLLAVSGVNVANSVVLGNTTGSLVNEVITVRDVAWTSTNEVWRNQASGMLGGSIPNDEYTFLSLTHAGNTFEIRTRLGGDNVSNGKETLPGQDGWTDFNLHGSTDPVPANLMTLRVGGVVESAIGRFDGYISEIIVYGAALNATERAEVDSYLKRKYDPATGTVVILE